MQIRKICDVCSHLGEKKAGITTCKRCALPVCKDHLDKKTGLCTMCSLPKMY